MASLPEDRNLTEGQPDEVRTSSYRLKRELRDHGNMLTIIKQTETAWSKPVIWEHALDRLWPGLFD